MFSSDGRVCDASSLRAMKVRMPEALMHSCWGGRAASEDVPPKPGDYSEGQSPGCQSGETCSLCLDPLREAGAVWRAPCGHEFHAACWGKAERHGHDRCPLCRAVISVKRSSARAFAGCIGTASGTAV